MSSRWTTSRSYSGPSATASSLVDRPSRAGSSTGVVGDEPARDQLTIGPHEVHRVAGDETADHVGDPGREQRGAPLLQRAHGPGVQVDLAEARGRVGQPQHP